MPNENIPIFSDTHCHLDMHAFSEDLNAVVQRAVDARLSFIIIPALACILIVPPVPTVKRMGSLPTEHTN